MIRYTLKCDRDHVFKSWFQSADAFEKLRSTGMASCAVCGSSTVDKTLMAPRVQPGRSKAAPPAPATVPEGQHEATTAPVSLSEPDSPLAKAIQRLRAEVEASSDYVGKDFVRQARAMHLGETQERAIHGEARPEDARALVEEGVPVLPLPFANRSKSN